MFVPPQRFFEVPKKPVTGWLEPVKDKPDIDSDEAKKKEYGALLAKGLKPFDAGLELCPDSTANAVWVSLHWLSDPIVLASKDVYLKTVEQDTPLLDKTQFAARLLQISEEKDEESGRYKISAKDRLGALELYAKVMKFTDDKDNSSQTFVHNTMIVKFVEPEKKSIAPTIDNNFEETVDSNIIPLKVKLAG